MISSHAGASVCQAAARTERLSEAVSIIRRRRSAEAADALLDECLSLLDQITDQSPLMRVATACAERHPPLRGPAGTGVIELDGDSPAITNLRREIASVARDAYVSVLIRGESGTGKERVARAIHRLSPRAGGPFVVVNCAGLTPTLAEDELFGHVRGAFTGAVADRRGPFERAHGGSVFLDEVGELTAEAQMKLLRALQQRTVQRLGSVNETAFDVRVIAATNANLESAVERGRFRHDLYYRLRVYELRVPSLRRRGEADVRFLSDAILKQLCARRGRAVATLAPEMWALFKRYAWPGNVRELENTLERMIVAAAGATVLTPAHVRDDLRLCAGEGQEAVERPGNAEHQRAVPSPGEARAALERNGFKYGRTASELGVSRHQLYRLLKRNARADAAIARAPG